MASGPCDRDQVWCAFHSNMAMDYLTHDDDDDDDDATGLASVLKGVPSQFLNHFHHTGGVSVTG